MQENVGKYIFFSLLKVFIVIAMMIILFVLGMMIGFGVIGGGNPKGIFNHNLWDNVFSYFR
ncbi:MAG: DNA-directed RNA polymerase subunit beta [Lactobacillales bacterium]|nr:DNA-directed RNA polymerase subunit beta [Lactobacillales bacterium]